MACLPGGGQLKYHWLRRLSKFTNPMISVVASTTEILAPLDSKAFIRNSSPVYEQNYGSYLCKYQMLEYIILTKLKFNVHLKKIEQINRVFMIGGLIQPFDSLGISKPARHLRQSDGLNYSVIIIYICWIFSVYYPVGLNIKP